MNAELTGALVALARAAPGGDVAFAMYDAMFALGDELDAQDYRDRTHRCDGPVCRVKQS